MSFNVTVLSLGDPVQYAYGWLCFSAVTPRSECGTAGALGCCHRTCILAESVILLLCIFICQLHLPTLISSHGCFCVACFIAEVCLLCFVLLWVFSCFVGISVGCLTPGVRMLVLQALLGWWMLNDGLLPLPMVSSATASSPVQIKVWCLGFLRLCLSLYFKHLIFGKTCYRNLPGWRSEANFSSKGKSQQRNFKTHKQTTCKQLMGKWGVKWVERRLLSLPGEKSFVHPFISVLNLSYPLCI